MSSAIQGLEPQLLWKYFGALSRIPRGSKNETAVAQFVLDTARQQGREARQDAAGNVIVKKPALKEGMAEFIGAGFSDLRKSRGFTWINYGVMR